MDRREREREDFVLEKSVDFSCWGDGILVAYMSVCINMT
jgi:hypothetical protein